jgi:MFS family permease
LICFSTFASFLALHSLHPTLPLYIERFGGTTKIAGLALTSLTVAAIFSRPIAGAALDRYGRKPFLLIGLFLFLIPMVFYIRLVPVAMLIALRFFQGIGWGFGNTAAGTVAADLVPSRRMGEGMGYFGLTLSISMAFSPALGLWLIEHYSFSELFIVCTFFAVLSLLLALFIQYPKIEKQLIRPKLVFMEKAALQPSLVILFIIFSYVSLVSFLPLYAAEQGLKTTGLFFTSFALTTIFSRPLSGIIVDQAGKKGYDFSVLIGTLAAAAAMPIIARSTSWLYLLFGGICYGIGFGFIQPTMLALSIRNMPPEKKGAANATFWTAVDIGAACGSLFWGFVAAAFGFRAMFNLNVIPPLIALAIYFVWKRS